MLDQHDQLIVLTIPELQFLAESFEILKVFVHQLYSTIKVKRPLGSPQTSKLCTEVVKVRVSGNKSMHNRIGASNSEVQRRAQQNRAWLTTRCHGCTIGDFLVHILSGRCNAAYFACLP
jgi:hypothetical protein